MHVSCNANFLPVFWWYVSNIKWSWTYIQAPAVSVCKFSTRQCHSPKNCLENDLYLNAVLDGKKMRANSDAILPSTEGKTHCKGRARVWIGWPKVCHNRSLHPNQSESHKYKTKTKQNLKKTTSEQSWTLNPFRLSSWILLLRGATIIPSKLLLIVCVRCTKHSSNYSKARSTVQCLSRAI